MSRPITHVEVWLLGGLFLAGLFLGGGTNPQLITDAIIQIATITICTSLLFMKRGKKVDVSIVLFLLLVFTVIIIQIVPLPIAVAKNIWPRAVQDAWLAADSAARFGNISIVADKTLSVMIHYISLALLLLVLAELSYDELISITRIVMLGVAVLMLMALMQMSTARVGVGIEVGLPFPLRAGAFTNANHFATMMMMVIPPIVYWAYQGNKILGFSLLALVWALLFGASSVAGILGGLAISLISINQFSDKKILRVFSLPALAITMVLFIAITYGSLTKISKDLDFGRLDFYKTTLSAIKQNLLFGTGFGTFVQAYQIYELPKDIYPEYVNHAHNDYLELILEGGLVAASAIVLYLLFIGWKAYSRRADAFAKIALLSIVAALVHSLVDYPLRTMAIGFLFVLAHAFLFATTEPVHHKRRRHSHRQNHDEEPQQALS